MSFSLWIAGHLFELLRGLFCLRPRFLSCLGGVGLHTSYLPVIKFIEGRDREGRKEGVQREDLEKGYNYS